MPSGDWRRLFRTEPERESDGEGVAFVSILFGVVAGLIVNELAAEVRAGFDPTLEIREARLLHLCVGAALTILSFLGYYSSTNRPRHQIKLFNLPLWLFVLDVLMVFGYYLVFTYTESPSDTVPRTPTDARPETFVVAFTFVLYFLWDVVSWRIKADPVYKEKIRTAEAEAAGTDEAADRMSDHAFGDRRMTTVRFMMAAIALALAVWVLDSKTPTTVIIIDIGLIVLLILYRAAKSYFDSSIDIRSTERSVEREAPVRPRGALRVGRRFD